jgi:hypothetical protein
MESFLKREARNVIPGTPGMKVHYKPGGRIPDTARRGRENQGTAAARQPRLRLRGCQHGASYAPRRR